MKKRITEGLLLLLSLVICIGSFTFFSACGAKEDGSFMNCHHAQVMLTALGALMAAESLAAMLFPNRKVTAGLDAAVCLTAVLTATVPGVLIPLCMMPSMHCRSVMQPVAVLLCVITAVTALAGCVRHCRGKEK